MIGAGATVLKVGLRWELADVDVTVNEGETGVMFRARNVSVSALKVVCFTLTFFFQKIKRCMYELQKSILCLFCLVCLF